LWRAISLVRGKGYLIQSLTMDSELSDLRKSVRVRLKFGWTSVIY